MTYKLVDTATEAPGLCFITRTSVGPFIDTGKKVWTLRPEIGTKVYEHVYIAVSTLLEIAQEAGILSAKDVELSRQYGEGYADALKENIGGDLNSLADTLGFISERLDSIRSALGGADSGSYLRVEGAEAPGDDEDSREDAERGDSEDGDRGDESPTLEGVDAYLDLRPARVSGRRGNGKPLADL